MWNVRSLGFIAVLAASFNASCSKKADEGSVSPVAAAPATTIAPTAQETKPLPPCTQYATSRPCKEPTAQVPDAAAGLSDDPAQRPASRFPPPDGACEDDSSTCPPCEDVAASIDEVPSRLKYLGIPFSLYSLGETEGPALSYKGTILIVDSKNESRLRQVLNGDFERFFDATAKVRKQHGLTTETARAEFNNLRLGLMGHIWCDGTERVNEPKRSTVSRRVAFAFVNRRIGFQRLEALDKKYGWSWPPGFKPLGFSALGDSEQLLEKVFESGNSLTGGVGHGYAVLRKSQDEMLDLRQRVANVIADFIVIPSLACNSVTREGKSRPCNVEGIEFPTMVLRDSKTKKAFLIQDGLTAD